jgi:hypothetical protein
LFKGWADPTAKRYLLTPETAGVCSRGLFKVCSRAVQGLVQGLFKGCLFKACLCRKQSVQGLFKACSRVLFKGCSRPPLNKPFVQGVLLPVESPGGTWWRQGHSQPDLFKATTLPKGRRSPPGVWELMARVGPGRTLGPRTLELGPFRQGYNAQKTDKTCLTL